MEGVGIEIRWPDAGGGAQALPQVAERRFLRRVRAVHGHAVAGEQIAGADAMVFGGGKAVEPVPHLVRRCIKGRVRCDAVGPVARVTCVAGNALKHRHVKAGRRHEDEGVCKRTLLERRLHCDQGGEGLRCRVDVADDRVAGKAQHAAVGRELAAAVRGRDMVRSRRITEATGQMGERIRAKSGHGFPFGQFSVVAVFVVAISVAAGDRGLAWGGKGGGNRFPCVRTLGHADRGERVQNGVENQFDPL